MASQREPGQPGSPEEKVTLDAEKDPEGPTWSSRSWPGCLTRAPWLLLLLLVSLGLCFLLLVATLVHVSRIPLSPQAEVQDQQGDPSLAAIPQEKSCLDLELIREQLAWINASLSALCHPCPWAWELFQESCYLFSWAMDSWEASVSSCQALGAQLVVINNAAEQRFLNYWDVRKSQLTWIGLSDHRNEGSWHWVDGSSLQLSFWKEGEPNNAGDEDCAELATDGWNDNKCKARNFWICEQPAAPCPGL